MAFISFACIAAVAFSNTQSGKTPMKSIVASPRALSLDMGLLAKLRGFGREKREVAELVEQIAVGAQLPVVDTEICSADGSYRVASLPEILGVGGINGTSLLIGMPGAFTPTCTKEHLPDIMTNIDSLTSSGVDRVAVMTTNDRFVNMAWRQALEATRPSTRAQYEKLVFLSDADGDAVKALGLAEDMGYGYGVRSTRFAVPSARLAIHASTCGSWTPRCSCRSDGGGSSSSASGTTFAPDDAISPGHCSHRCGARRRRFWSRQPAQRHSSSPSP
jgi:peroxiredoxin